MLQARQSHRILYASVILYGLFLFYDRGGGAGMS